ncbi:hypothetical protein [Nocardioides sp.]|uniref:hypothetical protein n=1 Tax=Nocardioides sp. TaxID=35761 RepID=UPI00378477BF
MTEETFVRELERRADHVHGAPLSFDDVRGTAHRIRRRRRAATAAVAAAAVALVVVVPTLLVGGHEKRGLEPAPSPVSPGASVLHDGVVTLSGGGSVPVDLDNEDVVQLGVLTDGRIVVATQRPYAVSVYAADGSLDRRYPVETNTFTMSAADDAVAWVADDFTVRVLTSGQPEPTTLPGIPMPGEAAGSIDAVLDPEHLLVGDHTTTTDELTPDGTRDLGLRDLPLDEQFRVVDVSPDGKLWAVSFLPGENDQYGCSGLYDPEARLVVARSCDVHATRFAPDGEHLLSAVYENNMTGDETVVDLHLEPVFTSRLTGSVVSRVGWADADHLLVAMADLDGQDWQLVRERAVPPLGDGDPEVLDGPAPGGNPETTAEYVLSE